MKIKLPKITARDRRDVVKGIIELAAVLAVALALQYFVPRIVGWFFA